MAKEKRPYTFKPFEELEFSDDFMFKKIMQNSEICIGVIERLLKIKVDHIEYPELQKEIAPYYTSKGVRLDVYVKDSNRIFDLEMQSANVGALGKRMRYYQSMIDINDLMKGTGYSSLKESYVIFICKKSPFKKSNFPVYSFRNICEENPTVELNDKTKKLVYNASAYEEEKDEELKAFLRFVCSGSATDDFTERINALVTQTKLAEAGKTEYMGMNLHDWDIRMAGRQEGREEGAIEAAKLLIEKYNIPIEQACADFNISPDLLDDIPQSEISHLGK